MRNKKGYTITDLVPIGLAFVVLGIVLSIGAQVVANVGADLTTGSVEKNATIYANEGIEELASWMPTIALVVVAAIIIGIIIFYLAKRM